MNSTVSRLIRRSGSFPAVRADSAPEPFDVRAYCDTL